MENQLNPIIFYSWQSDLPNPTNRGFIEDALKKAISQYTKKQSAVDKEPVMESAIRDDNTLNGLGSSDILETKDVKPVLDKDTIGVPGSPSIAETIFSKIERASVFVCDVSIIGKADKRPCPNPNVLIELGFAIKSLGENRVIMVANKAFGSLEELPFDIRPRKIASYELIESEQSEKKKKTAKEGLAKNLARRINEIFKTEGVFPPDNDAVKADRKLFEKFLEILPSNGSIKFIKDHNMNNAPGVADSDLVDLENFNRTWNNAEHEFLTEKLELYRKNLAKSISEYLIFFARETFPDNSGKYNRPLPEWLYDGQSQRYEGVVKVLHESADKIVKTHQELIRVAKKKLRV